MASALDEDTQRSLAAGQASARAFLRSIQKDLQKVFVVFLLGFLATFWALRTTIWEALYEMTRSNMASAVAEEVDVIATTPFEVILLQAKIGLVVGAIVALPALGYVSRDELRARGVLPQSPIARWKLAAVALLGFGLFGLGVAYGLYAFFPIMFAFLAGFGLEAGIQPTYGIVMWTEFIVFLSLSFGLAGQMPLLITGLSYAEIVPYETFRDKWRYAVVAIFVPADVGVPARRAVRIQSLLVKARGHGQTQFRPGPRARLDSIPLERRRWCGRPRRRTRVRLLRRRRSDGGERPPRVGRQRLAVPRPGHWTRRRRDRRARRVRRRLGRCVRCRRDPVGGVRRP
jgi:Sec-independent protein secretion pathway component TatC